MTDAPENDMITEMLDFSGKHKMTEQQTFVFEQVKAHMMREYIKEWSGKVKDPIIRMTKINTAKQVLDDAFKVVAQCTQQGGDDADELSPG